MRFTKMHGAGNDFVVLDGVRQKLLLTPDLIRRLADRHFGVGADQVLIVEPPENSVNDFRYRIFNQDGTEVEQCGNGARCFAQYVVQSGLSDKTQLRVETLAGVITPKLVAPGRVTVNMGLPSFAETAVDFDGSNLNTRQINQISLYTIELPNALQIKQAAVEFAVVSMGNPHAVILVESLALAPVHQLGKYLERHPRFAAKVNVGFLQVVDRSTAGLRVWERGVGETLACGTGACAAAVVGMQMSVFDHEVNIQKRGGQLTIAWQGAGTPVYMTGPAQTVFEGEWLDSTTL